jgi:riboflavin transporter FmnP
MDWLSGGAGVLTGVVATRGLPQLLMSSSNTGPLGYLMNAVATGVTTFAAHLAFPRNRVFSASVLAGGVAAIISRIIGDYSLLGSYSSQLGLGDYLMNFNFPIPQYLQPGNNRQLTAGGGPSAATLPVNVNGAVPAGVSGWGPQLY